MAGSRDGDGKKRTVKACDRCRLKKVKCDGTTPCLRCRQDDAICQFNVRSNCNGKSVSAAHVDQLQANNNLLVGALRAIWEKYAAPTLGEDSQKAWTIHDIVLMSGVMDETALRQLTESSNNGSAHHPSGSIGSVSTDNTDDSRTDDLESFDMLEAVGIDDDMNGVGAMIEDLGHAGADYHPSHQANDGDMDLVFDTEPYNTCNYNIPGFVHQWSPFIVDEHLQQPCSAQQSMLPQNLSSSALSSANDTAPSAKDNVASMHSPHKSSLNRPNRPQQKIEMPNAAYIMAATYQPSAQGDALPYDHMSLSRDAYGSTVAAETSFSTSLAYGKHNEPASFTQHAYHWQQAMQSQ